jgi:tetraacyldisaccharide 4'-kinase
MDDGLQNPGLVRDAGVLVIDGAAGFGNGHLLPAGPLRESVARAASRCAVAVLIGADETGALAALPARLPVMRAAMAPGAAMVALAGRRVVAFAGIGRPGKFFNTLREAGVVVAAEIPFADHHVYGAGELARLARRAAGADALLVTTTKDFVRINAALRGGIVALSADVVWQEDCGTFLSEPGAWGRGFAPPAGSGAEPRLPQ